MPGYIYCELRAPSEDYVSIQGAVDTARLMASPGQYGVAVLRMAGVERSLVVLRLEDWRDVIARLDRR